MIIESVRVEAFRGIRNLIEVDFTAPLTVLYAPNGTGKTTVCDALEWLLTGRIERLNAGAEDVWCIFADGPRPYVEAALRVHGDRFHVRRRYDAAGVVLERWGAGTDEFSVVETGDLLEWVSGLEVTAGTEAERVQEIRSTWLRASRLLAGPALDLLLEPAEDGGSVRSLAFSELFGVGNLQKQELELERVLQVLEPKEIERELRELSAALAQGARAELSATPASATLRAEASAHLATTAELLQAQIPPDLDAAYRGFRVRHTQERALIERQADALARVQPALLHYQLWSREAELLREQLKSLAEHSLALGAERDALLGAMEESRVERDQVSLRLQECSRLHGEIRGDLGLLRDLLDEAAKYGVALDDPPDAEGAEVAAKEAARALDRQNERQMYLAACIRGLAEWRQLSSRLAVWKGELKEVEELLALAGEEAELQRRVLETADALGRLRARRSDLLTPLQSVHAAAETLLASLADSPECPLCGHRHATPEALRRAMEAALAAGPSTASHLAGDIARLEEEVAALEARRRDRARLRDRRKRLIKATHYPRAVLKEARKQLERVELTLGDLERDDLQSELDRMLETSEEAVRAARDHARQASGAYQSVRALDEAGRRFVRRMTDYQAAADVPLAGRRERQATHPGTWASRLREAAQQLAKRLEEDRIRLAELESAASRLRIQADDAGVRLESMASEHAEAERRLRDLHGEMHRFDEDWRTLGSEAPPSERALEAATSRIVRRREAVSRIGAHLDDAGRLLDEARAAGEKEVAEQVRSEEESRKWSRRRELEVLMEHCDAINQAVLQIREQKKKYVEYQFAPLRDSISALYVRTQANSVYGRIGSEMNARGAMEYHAEADGIRLERMAELSQGQRQNLALAIFLARARSLGGTFFMDEPLAHLDDINRVALLDVLRVLVAERSGNPLRLVLTTADLGLVRHLREKLSRIPRPEPSVILRTYAFHGNPRSGVQSEEETVPSLQAEHVAHTARTSVAST